MNKFCKALIFPAFMLYGLLISIQASAQSFKKGSLLISISEGSTDANYTTTYSEGGTDVLHTAHIGGARDPLTMEYGLTNHWGIGLNMGGDIYSVDPSKFYDFQTMTNKVKAITSELTLDANYHFFVNRHWDLSTVASLGFSSVSFKGNDGDLHYQYNAGGLLVRTGAKAKYYITKRFGVMGMLSAFATQCGTDGVKGNTVGNNYTTNITGRALEFGLCYRILR